MRVFLKKILIVLSCWIVTGMAFGQIVDDSSKLVYGPATTKVYYDEDAKNNIDRYHTLDTVLYKFENFSLYDENDRFYQDLGNNGTAMAPIFYEVPDFIGKSSGFTSYDRHFKYPHQQKYYDTKSPYMDVGAVFGGQGRATVDFTFTANVNPKWNVGIDYHRINSDKQIGASQNEGDLNARKTVYDIFTYYQHETKPYKLFFNFTNYLQKGDETGGVLVLSENPLEFEFFQYRDSRIQLEDATTENNANNLHLYHEYGFFKQFQLYHQLDRFNQENTYADFTDSGTSTDYDTYSDFYDVFLIDPDSTIEGAKFSSFSNEIGLKGSISSVFYRFYVRQRNVDFTYRLLNQNAVTEGYLGGLARFDWKGFKVQARAEFLSTGGYDLRGSLESPILEASYRSTLYESSYLYDNYFGNHYEWHNGNTQGFANVLKGNLKLKFGELDFKPGVSLSNFDEFFYFDQNRIARQAVGTALMTQIGGHINYKLFTNREYDHAFHFHNQVLYTTTAGGAGDLLRVPELFFNGRYYWAGKIFQRSVPVEIGLNAHGKSAYFANGFDPVTQQFHLQDELEIDPFLAVDFFINMRVDKVFAFLKVTHLNQGNNTGYFVTPYYPGQSRVIDLGVRWMFFD